MGCDERPIYKGVDLRMMNLLLNNYTKERSTTMRVPQDKKVLICSYSTVCINYIQVKSSAPNFKMSYIQMNEMIQYTVRTFKVPVSKMALVGTGGLFADVAPGMNGPESQPWGRVGIGSR